MMMMVMKGFRRAWRTEERRGSQDGIPLEVVDISSSFFFREGQALLEGNGRGEYRCFHGVTTFIVSYLRTFRRGAPPAGIDLHHSPFLACETKH